VTGSSTERGYGVDHRRRRELLLPSAYGRPCPLCGVVMTKADDLDLDHKDPLSLNPNSTGDRITHASCNRSRGNGQRAGDTDDSREW
jgi:hypothetical protein